MKLPRWLLVSLIVFSCVVLLAVPAWLWVEMPRWTAAQFVAAAEAGDSYTLSQLIGPCEIDELGCLRITLHNGETASFGCSGYYVVPRTILDVIEGRQTVVDKIRNGKGAVEIIASCTRVTAHRTWFD